MQQDSNVHNHKPLVTAGSLFIFYIIITQYINNSCSQKLFKNILWKCFNPQWNSCCYILLQRWKPAMLNAIQNLNVIKYLNRRNVTWYRDTNSILLKCFDGGLKNCSIALLIVLRVRKQIGRNLRHICR